MRTITTPDDPGYEPKFRELGIATIRGFPRKATTRLKQWIRNGCPLLPQLTIDTRSPSFVMLVLIVFVIGMLLPEVLGLTHPYPQSGLPPQYNAAN